MGVGCVRRSTVFFAFHDRRWEEVAAVPSNTFRTVATTIEFIEPGRAHPRRLHLFLQFLHRPPRCAPRALVHAVLVARRGEMLIVFELP